jgi:hypothetical protein
MEGKADDVRLPFSVMDPIMGDVFSVVWEPKMMGETGNALRILTSEVLTSVGQQVLAATVMATLMSALQWPISVSFFCFFFGDRCAQHCFVRQCSPNFPT